MSKICCYQILSWEWRKLDSKVNRANGSPWPGETLTENSD